MPLSEKPFRPHSAGIAPVYLSVKKHAKLLIICHTAKFMTKFFHLTALYVFDTLAPIATEMNSSLDTFEAGIGEWINIFGPWCIRYYYMQS